MKKQFDFWFLGVALVLCLLGVLNIYSATVSDISSSVRDLWKNQIIWTFVGFGAAIGFSFINYNVWMKYSYIIYAIALVMLVAVDILGHTSQGSQRWLNLGIARVQPSEFIKIAMILVLARYFHRDQYFDGYSLLRILPPAGLLAVPFVLIMAQPDLGTAVMVTLVFISIVMLVRVKVRSILILAIVALVSIPPVYKYVLHDYQRKRIETFLNPFSDPRGAGYNSIQSMIAVGSGGLFGKGYLKGTQTQLHFLPEQHTDFAFSAFSEEHGFIGFAIILSLYMILIYRTLFIAGQSKDIFGACICVGFAGMLFWHVFINMGMTSGVLPIVGIPLPFISYGGSSLLTILALIGIVTNISNNRFIFHDEA